MSLTVDGRAALIAIARAPDRFDRIKDRDWAGAAIKFTRKQLTAAGQTRNDIREIRSVLGDDIFEKSLDALSALHAKQLAKRIDPTVDPDTIKTGSMALAHVRRVLSEDWPASSETPETEVPNTDDPPAAPKANPYIGRKAFRTGR